MNRFNLTLSIPAFIFSLGLISQDLQATTYNDNDPQYLKNLKQSLYNSTQQMHADPYINEASKRSLADQAPTSRPSYNDIYAKFQGNASEKTAELIQVFESLEAQKAPPKRDKPVGDQAVYQNTMTEFFAPALFKKAKSMGILGADASLKQHLASGNLEKWTQLQEAVEMEEACKASLLSYEAELKSHNEGFHKPVKSKKDLQPLVQKGLELSDPDAARNKLEKLKLAVSTLDESAARLKSNRQLVLELMSNARRLLQQDPLWQGGKQSRVFKQWEAALKTLEGDYDKLIGLASAKSGNHNPLKRRDLSRKILKTQNRLFDRLEAAVQTKGLVLKKVKTKKVRVSDKVGDGFLVAAANNASKYLTEEVYHRNYQINYLETILSAYDAHKWYPADQLKAYRNDLQRFKRIAVDQHFNKDNMVAYVQNKLRASYPDKLNLVRAVLRENGLLATPEF